MNGTGRRKTIPHRKLRLDHGNNQLTRMNDIDKALISSSGGGRKTRKVPLLRAYRSSREHRFSPSSSRAGFSNLVGRDVLYLAMPNQNFDESN